MYFEKAREMRARVRRLIGGCRELVRTKKAADRPKATERLGTLAGT
jgi:hypothetical protein